MVRIEKDTITVEIKVPDPGQFYRYLLTGIPDCIQAIAERGIDERDLELPNSLLTLTELYKQLLPTEKQIERMVKKK